MSLTFKSKISSSELVEFLASEYEVSSGIPVHLYSVVNAYLPEYNKCLAITDGGIGTMFLEGEFYFKSYGNGNPIPLMRTLNHCNFGISIID